MTVSIGVAAMAAVDDAGAGDLIRCADAALYQAKQRGRNRVERAVAATSNARDFAVL